MSLLQLPATSVNDAYGESCRTIFLHLCHRAASVEILKLQGERLIWKVTVNQMCQYIC